MQLEEPEHGLWCTAAGCSQGLPAGTYVCEIAARIEYGWGYAASGDPVFEIEPFCELHAREQVPELAAILYGAES